MQRVHLSAISFLLLLGLAILPGCSDDDPAEPEVDTYVGLWGYVVDGEGAAVEDAAIGIILDYPLPVGFSKANVIVAHPLEKPMTQFAFEIPEDAHVRIWIEDYAGDPVRTLVDEELIANEYEFLWNALDDDQQPVAAGLYTVYIELDGVPGDQDDFLLVYLDSVAFLNAPNAVTDANGRFRIADSLLPIGETLDAYDEVGEPIGAHTIGDTLRVMAVREGDPDPVWTLLTVQYDAGTANRAIEIVLE